MTRIKTRAALAEYILRRLGSPSIQVELTEEQLDDAIYDAIEEFSYYAMDGMTEHTIVVSLDHGKGDYLIDSRIVSIDSIRTTSNINTMYRLPNGYVLSDSILKLNNIGQVDVQSLMTYQASVSNVLNSFDIPLNYSFNELTSTLSIFEEPEADTALLEVSFEYEPQTTDKIWGHEWIKAYSLALAKITWGQVVGKYTSQLSNGTEINFDRILSEGFEEKEALMERLKEDYRVPLGVSRG